MTDPTYPMTNAELAQAIADTRTYAAIAHIASEGRLFFDHLSELLRIQRERAAQVGAPTRVIMGVTEWFYRAPYDTDAKWHTVAP